MLAADVSEAEAERYELVETPGPVFHIVAAVDEKAHRIHYRRRIRSQWKK